MRFIYDKILHWDLKGLIPFPVVVFQYHTPPVLKSIFRIRFLPPYFPSANQLGIGIKQYFFLIKAIPFLRGIRTVHAITILHIFYVESVYYHRKNISYPEILRERDPYKRLFFTLMEKQKFAGDRIFRKNRKVYPVISYDTCPKGLNTSAAVLYSV